MADTHSTENRMTLAALQQDKWASVQLPLPQGATRKLLIAARAAAQGCADDARRIVQTHDREDADSVGHAMEMGFMAEQADNRIDQIDSRLSRAVAPRGRGLRAATRALG